MMPRRQYRQQMAPDYILIVLYLVTINSVSFTESSPASFGDVDPTPSPGYQRLLTCEGNVMDIHCSTSEPIKIHTAMLGRALSQPPSTCGQSGHLGETCSSTKAFEVVDRSCSGNSGCTLHVSKATFRDWPCNVNVKVYLHVEYSCTSLTPPPPTSTPLPSVEARTAMVDPKTCGPYVGDIKCRRCLKRNISWPETEAGNWATAPCPNNDNLVNARLQCGLDPVEWIGHPDLSKCLSSSVELIQSKLKKQKNAPTILGSFAVQLTAISHQSGTLAGGDLVGITQAMYDVVQQLDASTKEKSGDVKQSIQQVSSAVLDVTNTFLDEQRTASWNDIPQNDWGSVANQLMNTVETSAFQIASVLTLSQKVTNVSENLVVEVSVIDANADVSMEDAVFPNADALKGSSWEKTTNSLRLPAESLRSLAENGLAKVVFTSYSNLENLLLPNAISAVARSDDANSRFRSFCSDLTERGNCSAIINTKIISATINSRKLRGSEMILPKPVVFTLQHRITENVSEPICAYWKFNDEVGAGGQWMTDGCESNSNLTHTTCSCNHLTSFAIIMSPTAPNISAANALALDVLTYIGCSISIICLFLSFVTFAIFRNLQCDRNTIHKNLVLCLFIANMIFIIGIDLTSLPIFCSVIAGFLHYFFLASFGWMCIEGVQLYYMLIKVFEADKSHILWFYLSAYGVPAIIVTISAAVGHEGYGTEKYCWLSTENGLIWSFLAPVICIILANSVMLGIAIRAMYQHSVSAATWRMKEKTKLQQIRSWVKGSLVLIVLLGLTWTFGLLYVNESMIAFAYIFTILNSVQGLFIFIFHCLLNDKVQAEYKRCVRNATCLPERFRIWYGGARASYTSNPNQSSSSSTGGKYFSRLLTKRPRNSSQSTSISRLTSSQKRSSLLRQDEEKVKSSLGVSDSGIEDPSNYQESAQIHVGDSEFNTVSNFSTLEGSIADTDYAERMTQRNSSSSDRKSNSRNNSRSTPVSSVTSEEPPQKESRPSRKSRNQPAPNDHVAPDQQRQHKVQSVPQRTEVVSSSPDPYSAPPQRPSGAGRKSSKTGHQDSGNADVLNSKRVSDSQPRASAAEDSQSPPNNGVPTDKDVARRHSKPRANSAARISGKTTGV